ADRNRSHWSTSKTPSYTKSVSWHHYQESRKEEYLNDSVQFMNRSLAQITGENMIGANGRSVPEMALPESYNYIHKSGTLHEAPSPIIPLNWSKASMTLMLKEMSNLINDEGIK
ncbi:hypothetical protein ACK6U8_18310, partial [Escherichia coli]